MDKNLYNINHIISYKEVIFLEIKCYKISLQTSRFYIKATESYSCFFISILTN